MPRIVPVIDISQLARDEPTRQAFLRDLRSAARDVGFFSPATASRGSDRSALCRLPAIPRASRSREVEHRNDHLLSSGAIASPVNAPRDRRIGASKSISASTSMPCRGPPAFLHGRACADTTVASLAAGTACGDPGLAGKAAADCHSPAESIRLYLGAARGCIRADLRLRPEPPHEDRSHPGRTTA